LLEVLVTMSIMGIMLAVLVPALHATRSAARSIVCSTNMKSMAMEFHFFVRGESEASPGGGKGSASDKISINDFQESLYGLDEFWDPSRGDVVTLKSGDDPMLCPAGAVELKLRRGFPCSPKAFDPVEDVSVAMNMRLYRAVLTVKGKKLLAPAVSTRLGPRVLDRTHVPLVMDADGRAAVRKGIEPFYMAPPVKSGDPYANGRHWFPGLRHGGKATVGFVGGHVLTSSQPERERWDWAYQGDVGK
jgi:prepilin-type processing-associated H-X9-DG protein